MKAYSWFVGSIQKHIQVWGVILLTMSLLAFWQASKLQLDGDLGRLLPEDAPSVQGLRALESVYGDQIGRLTVVLRNQNPEALREIADALTEDLVEIPGVQRVVHKKPQSALEDYRLLYLELDDLEEVQDRLNRRIRWEKQRANPLFIEVRKSEPPSVDMSDIGAKYGGEDPYYQTATGELLVFVHADFPAADLDRSRQLVSAVSEVVGAREVDFALTGRYQKRIDQQELLTQDIVRATPAALLFIFLFLLVYFRSVISVVYVLVPLVLGTAAGMAVAGLIFGSLNILTGFLAAVLMGLGVDYGIHLVSRYLDARANGHATRKAWEDTFKTSGRASIFSGLTTILALASLSTSSFRAFYEFGIVASLGIALILVSYALVVPWLIFLLDRSSPAPALATKVGEDLGALIQRHAHGGRKWAFRAVYVLSAFVILVGIGRLEFDRTFDSLSVTDSESWQLDELVNRTLETSQTPAVFPVESTDHLERVLQELETRRSGPHGYTLGEVLSTRDLLPPDQAPKREILLKLQGSLQDIPERARSVELNDFLSEVEVVLDAGELKFEGLPDSIRIPFSRRDDVEASVVLIMPAIDLNDATASRDFSEVLRGLPGPTGIDVKDAISDTLLLTEILEFVERDTAWMLEITLAGLVLVALIAFRFTWDAVRVVLFLVATMGSALGLMGLLGIQLNFINVLILPIWLGLGVDASFHLLIHLRDHPDEPKLHAATIVSIAAAFITSMIGFGALMMSHHVGLNSLGYVAVVGFSVMVLLNLVIGLDISKRVARKL